jgi:alanyl-tRNA synthetase
VKVLSKAVHAESDRLSDIAQLLKGDSQNIGDKVRSVLERTRQLEKNCSN